MITTIKITLNEPNIKTKKQNNGFKFLDDNFNLDYF